MRQWIEDAAGTYQNTARRDRLEAERVQSIADQEKLDRKTLAEHSDTLGPVLFQEVLDFLRGTVRAFNSVAGDGTMRLTEKDGKPARLTMADNANRSMEFSYDGASHRLSITTDAGEIAGFELVLTKSMLAPLAFGHNGAVYSPEIIIENALERLLA